MEVHRVTLPNSAEIVHNHITINCDSFWLICSQSYADYNPRFYSFVLLHPHTQACTNAYKIQFTLFHVKTNRLETEVTIPDPTKETAIKVRVSGVAIK